MDKKSRQAILLSILSQEAISSQEELQEKALRQGIKATQATLSRDLREMGVSKQPVPGKGVIYTPQASILAAKQSVGSIEFAAGLAVLKTAPGYAPAVASRIDHSKLPAIAGTIAGDDTVLLAIRSGYEQKDVINNLSTTILL